MSYENIIVEKEDGVGVITLNRPKALNALCKALIEDMERALDDLESDDAIGCILITGSEKAFAAGADIKEMKDKTSAGLRRGFHHRRLGAPGQDSQAGGRGGGRLCFGRRL